MAEPESQQDGLEPSARSFAWSVFVNGGTLAVRGLDWWGLILLGVTVTAAILALPAWAAVAVVAVALMVVVVMGAHRTTVKAIRAGVDGEQQARERRKLDEDHRALATGLNDFFMERRAGIKQVSGDQANRYEMETRQIYERRFQAQAFLMCERLHARGRITDRQWKTSWGSTSPSPFRADELSTWRDGLALPNCHATRGDEADDPR